MRHERGRTYMGEPTTIIRTSSFAPPPISREVQVKIALAVANAERKWLEETKKGGIKDYWPGMELKSVAIGTWYRTGSITETEKAVLKAIDELERRWK